MKSRNILLIFLILIALIMLSIFIINKIIETSSKPVQVLEETYNPIINPNDFTTNINNKYFTLIPGTKYIYQANTKEGIERNEVYVTNKIKNVMGVNARVVFDRVWLNDGLIEETYDWYAQDKEGNVWYFGEDSKEIANGIVVSTKGSWETGVNGAKPGIIMKANPKIGDVYRQEYYKGEAEDISEVIESNELVTVPFGSFNNCMKTLDYTPLEPDVKEYKYYCHEVGAVVLETSLNSGGRVELLSIDYNIEPSNLTIVRETQVLMGQITEEKAREIALKEIPGKITDVSIEKKLGKTTYVIQIDADNGTETDVIIDIETGEVLGIGT